MRFTFLGQNEYEEILRLRQDGWKCKDIAKRFNVCEATAFNIVNGKTVPRRRRDVVTKIRNAYAALDFEEEDFSKKPDDALFQHVRVRDFIG